MSTLQYLFRPRFRAHPGADASTSRRFQTLLAAWQRAFPESYVDPRIDLEDWAENAEQLCVALELAKRYPGSLELFVDDGTRAAPGRHDFSAIRPIPHLGETFADVAGRHLDMGRPFLFGGAEQRVGDFISVNEHLVAPGRGDMASADAYFHNPGFWEHAHRHMAFAAYDDGEGDVPADSNVLSILMERRDAGVDFAMVKVAATKRGIARIALTGQSEAELRQQLVDHFEWTLVELAGRADALLVQDFVPMRHEYRVFVVDGAPVAGAGCIEEFTPMDNTGSDFDERTREIRISVDGSGRQVAPRPDVVDRYKAALPGIVKDLINGNPRMRTFVLDLCMVGDQVAVVEVNGARNAGLYAMNYGAVFAAKVAAAQRALCHHETKPSPTSQPTMSTSMTTAQTASNSPQLWLATVSHVAVPGTVPAFFYLEAEPEDRLVLGQFGDFAKESELRVSGMFNLTHTLGKSADSREAFRLGAQQVRRQASNEGAPRLWIAMVDHFEVPGTAVEVFFQEAEPTGADVFSRFSDVDSDELEVVGIFDATYSLWSDPGSLMAVQMAHAAEFAAPATPATTQSASPAPSPRRRPRP